MNTRVLKILAISLMCAATGTLVAQVTVTNFYSFLSSPYNDGAAPEAGLVQWTNGNFYGTCSSGGNSDDNPAFPGTIFVVNPGGVEASIYSFLGPLADDGDAPGESLALGKDGNFYGTTTGGGAMTTA